MIEDGFNVNNMRQIGYPSIISHNYPKEYSINYSCFGWALGINFDIESLLESGAYVTHQTLPRFLNEMVTLFDNSIFLKDFYSLKSYLVQYNFSNNVLLTNISNYQIIPNYKPCGSDIIFFFGRNEETRLKTNDFILLHAARYLSITKFGEKVLVRKENY